MNKLITKKVLLMVLAGSAIAGVVFLLATNKDVKNLVSSIRESASGALNDTLEKLSKGEMEMS